MKKQISNQSVIPSVNYHLWEPCNMRCKFCFATFQDVKAILPKGHLPKEKSLEVVSALGEFGFEKITFAGGEPTLCPWLFDLVAEAKRHGLVSGIVTNGTKLTPEYLIPFESVLDWVALSVDSFNLETNLTSGRAFRGNLPIVEEEYLSLTNLIKSFGFKLKINTVVSRYNYLEDMNDQLLQANPERWKILQVLPVKGQNDKYLQAYQIGNQEYNCFLQTNRKAIDHFDAVIERNELISGSYLMVDPKGRFFDDTKGEHYYGEPILEVGVEKALEGVEFDFGKFKLRGGIYKF